MAPLRAEMFQHVRKIMSADSSASTPEHGAAGVGVVNASAGNFSGVELVADGGIMHPEPAYQFDDILFLMLSLALLWVSGRAFKTIGFPGLVGEIVMGIIIGPNVSNLAPRHETMMLFGELGLILLVMEAGLDVDIQMIQKVGMRAFGVAITGTMLPMIIGFTLATIQGHEWRNGLAVGLILAPTSAGIVLNVLSKGKVLQTETGQLIIAAAILDDIIALVLLSELEALADPTAWTMIKPILVASLLLGGIGGLAMYVLPKFLKKVLRLVSDQHQDNFILGLIFSTAIGLIPGVHYAGASHLLGAFLAGFSFCSDTRSHHIWVRQVKRIMYWLLTLFFGCTIGFEVPVQTMFTGPVVAAAMAYFVAIAAKLSVGFWAWPRTKFNVLLIGLAMCARGEFAFVVAATARSAGLISPNTFAATILAVLLSVIICPTLLRLTIQFRDKIEGPKRLEPEMLVDHQQDASAPLAVLNAIKKTAINSKHQRSVLRLSSGKSDSEEDDEGRGASTQVKRHPVFLQLNVKCKGRPGQMNRVLQAMIDLRCQIIDLRVYHPEGREGAFDYRQSAWFKKKDQSAGQNVMTAEFLLMDETLMLPLAVVDREDLQLWDTRHGDLRRAMKESLEDHNAVVEAERWFPGLVHGHMVRHSPEHTGDPWGLGTGHMTGANAHRSDSNDKEHPSNNGSPLRAIGGVFRMSSLVGSRQNSHGGTPSGTTDPNLWGEPGQERPPSDDVPQPTLEHKGSKKNVFQRVASIKLPHKLGHHQSKKKDKEEEGGEDVDSPPSPRTVFAHADLHLRRRYAFSDPKTLQEWSTKYMVPTLESDPVSRRSLDLRIQTVVRDAVQRGLRTQESARPGLLHTHTRQFGGLEGVAAIASAAIEAEQRDKEIAELEELLRSTGVTLEPPGFVPPYVPAFQPAKSGGSSRHRGDPALDDEENDEESFLPYPAASAQLTREDLTSAAQGRPSPDTQITAPAVATTDIELTTVPAFERTDFDC